VIRAALVGWRASWLDDVNVASANILVDFHHGLSVGEGVHGGMAKVRAEVAANFPGKRDIGVATKDAEFGFDLIHRVEVERGFRRKMGNLGRRRGLSQAPSDANTSAPLPGSE
jgi:hypothetical protein